VLLQVAPRAGNDDIRDVVATAKNEWDYVVSVVSLLGETLLTPVARSMLTLELRREIVC
jgi:hypothetical protein